MIQRLMTRIKASPVLQASLHPVHTGDWILLKQFFDSSSTSTEKDGELARACTKEKSMARWVDETETCPIQHDDDWAFAYSSALIAVEYASVPLESLLRPFCQKV